MAGLDPNMMRNLPVSSQWLTKLVELGAENCFSPAGKLRAYSEKVENPLWCWQLLDRVPATTSAELADVIPVVQLQKLGKQHSPKVTPFNYYTKAWSYFPCACQYRYENHKDHPIGMIGSGFPPLCATRTEA